MIIPMSMIRLMGRKADLPRTLTALQDVGTLHLCEPVGDTGIARPAPSLADRRRRRDLERALADVEGATAGLAELGALDVATPAAAAPAPPTAPVQLARAAWRAARTRRATGRLLARRRALLDERDALRVYAPLFADLEPLLGADHPHRRFTVHLLRVRSDGATLRRLREVLTHVVGEHELRSRTLPGGEVALLLLAPTGRSDEVERLLAEARVETAPVPLALGGGSLLEALPRLRDRLVEVDRELTAIADEAAALAAAHGALLRATARACHDCLRLLDARAQVAETEHAFVVEGWVPTRARPALVAGLRRALASDVVVEELSRDAWHGSEAPVVLTNPAVFEPFERLTAMLPLPRYGTVDPTPFVAVFFPLLFGVIVGDVGYALLLAIIAAVLWRGPRHGLRRDLAMIAAAVAGYAAIFGFLYGELFGDLGAHWFGLRPLWLDRAEAILPFLGLAIALGLVHIVLGLVVAAIARRRHPRESAGRGLTALMLCLIAVALAATFELLPGALFTPAIVALLIAFPVLIALEGTTALLELITTIGHVFSYARVMALGTASVMLAIVANQMVGAFGGAAIGVVFALLFHLVNFGIALFSPTIHVLRLHYVEFFGTFFDPGGGPYRPFAHEQPPTVTTGATGEHALARAGQE